MVPAAQSISEVREKVQQPTMLCPRCAAIAWICRHEHCDKTYAILTAAEELSIVLCLFS